MSAADTFAPMSPAEEALKRTVQRLNLFNRWLSGMDEKELACYRQLVKAGDAAAISAAYDEGNDREFALFGLDLHLVNTGAAA